MKIVGLNGPSQDACDRFFGWPTPLLYALAPTVASITAGDYNLEFTAPIYDPLWYVEEVNGRILDSEFSQVCSSADVVCASTTYDALYPTLRLLAAAKRMKPELVTILGGPHVDEVHALACGNEIVKESSLVDIAISGDGEYALLAVLRALNKGGIDKLDLSGVEGRACIYAEGRLIGITNERLNLDKLPFLPLRLADTSRHRNDFDIFRDGDGNIVPTAQMLAQRGCAYSCEFCSERRELAYLGARSVDNITEEVLLRRDQGFGAIFFDDSTFGLYPQLPALLDSLGHTGMMFGCLNRFDRLTTPDLLRAYREAGFKYFYCSIEQLEDDALQRMGKHQDKSGIIRSMELLEDYGFAVGVSLLYGLPYESDRSIKSTLDFTAKWVDRGVIQLVSESVLCLHPGTPAGRNSIGIFNRLPPNRGYPFDRFEEGQWEHPEHVTEAYLESILKVSEERFGQAMRRNSHSWSNHLSKYAGKGWTENSVVEGRGVLEGEPVLKANKPSATAMEII
jgi:radical SAM superfamily enzyme YgiQ (UPF0313 family)